MITKLTITGIGEFFLFGGPNSWASGRNRFACNKQLLTLLDLRVSSLRSGHANLLCIVPILTDDPRRLIVILAIAAAHDPRRESKLIGMNRFAQGPC